MANCPCKIRSIMHFSAHPVLLNVKDWQSIGWIKIVFLERHYC